ncbi:NERD domain-containing protein [Aliarcobacter skirrowii]|uniref:NERD domain-containing protein n=3 Tax=Aliarcobacter skirrowii TaxID=28200 RepID=UPI0008259B28|nr:NERD domain-containing protein [Aliarcobacter skirrowii]MDX4062705.1 NERD domain-containing protein [Aliarcobacter skirrowii]MDX4066310.1 NERD domain-containing protein [Aliarcobacter skirrowii]
MFEFFLLIIILFIFLLKYKNFEFFIDKGKLGEWKVDKKLKQHFHLNETIYEDLIFNLESGRTTQIDHIIVSQNGIFVIETKNMRGWIYCSENSKLWTQIVYKQKNTFQNPIHQNYFHIKALSEVLNIDNKNIHSIVVFIGESQFKTSIPKNVFNDNQYITYIKSFKEIIFNETELKRINNIIQTKSHKNIKEHLNNLHFTKNINNKIVCKKCGGNMNKRINKKINKVFLGCSNYPRCKNTETI